MKKDIVFDIWLSTKFPTPSASAGRLLADFGGAKNLYEATENDLKSLGYLKAVEIARLMKKDTAEAEKIIERCYLHNIEITSIEEDGYPSKLKNIYNPPVVLYTKGKLADTENAITIAVVGARNPLDTSVSVADSIVRDLAKVGCTVISGLAYGIDSVAHKAALQVGGNTVGVLACGLDTVYPRESEGLAQFVMSNGGLVSEYPPYTRAYKGNFAYRNRIISGLSDGVLIIEAGEKSGTMLTAHHAIEQNKDLFVVPGDVYRYSASNALLKNGAKPVTQATDILEEYVYVSPEKIKATKPVQDKVKRKVLQSMEPAKPKSVSKEDLTVNDIESKVLSCFGEDERFTVDQVCKKTSLSVEDVIVSLTLLTVKGYLKALDGNTYQRK